MSSTAVQVYSKLSEFKLLCVWLGEFMVPDLLEKM